LTYDALGRRLSKKVAGVETRWVWDGDVILHEVLGARSVTWGHGPGSFAPIARLEEGTILRQMVLDHLGVPLATVDEAGTLVSDCLLDAFGVPHLTEKSGHGSSPRWPGQYADDDVGLTYNRFRYYDSRLGAYISQDPIGLAGGLALYGYVEDPTIELDPRGLVAILWEVQGSVDAQAYPGPPAGGKEHKPLHFHLYEGDDETRILAEDYYKKGKLVASTGDKYPGDAAPTKNMRALVRNNLATLVRRTREVFETGGCK